MEDKIIFFDIDGTIYENKNKTIIPSTIKAIEELAKKENIKLAIATGRAGFMLHSIEAIIKYIDYFVLSNGQYITNKHEAMFKFPLDKKDVHKLVDELNKSNVVYGFTGSHSEAVNFLNNEAKDIFLRLSLNEAPVDPNFYLKNDVYQIWTFSTKKQIENVINANPHFQFTRWLDVGYDILPRDTSKGQGVIKLANHLGYDIKNVFAIGDGDNDEEMLKLAGVGIAMGNATTKTKTASNYITDDISADGLYNALKHFKLI